MPQARFIDINPRLLQCVELRPLSGAESNGHIVEFAGRASETIKVAFTSGPLKGKGIMVILPRDNLDLSKPVDLDGLGELCIVSGPAGR
jgi:hypothetical protein